MHPSISNEDSASGVNLLATMARSSRIKLADAWELADADSQRGERLLAAGRVEAAAPLIERGHAVLLARLGPESLYTRKAAERLARLAEVR